MNRTVDQGLVRAGDRIIVRRGRYTIPARVLFMSRGPEGTEATCATDDGGRLTRPLHPAATVTRLAESRWAA